MSVNLIMTGDKQTITLLSELPKRVASKGNKAAVTAAAKPIRPAVKAKAPRQSGLLNKAIGTKVKTYKGGTSTTAVSVIGARRSVQGEYKGKRRVPANYIHLVADGTRHSKGNDFVKEAYRSTKDQAEKAASDKFAEVITKEIGKLKAK